MDSKSSQLTLKKLYETLDFDNSANLVTEKALPEDVYQKMLFEVARKKLKIESIFFYRPPKGGVSVPYIYFCRLDGQNQAHISQKLAELHKLAWNMGRAPLLIAALPQGEIKIYNCYASPTEPSSYDYQAGLIDILNIFSEAERARRYHRYEFESGQFWQRNRERFSQKTRADYTLLEYLKIVRRKLINLLLKYVDFEFASEVAHNLLGRSIFIKYLEDRRDTNGNNVFPEGFWGKNADCFTDVLPDKEVTYKIFDELNKKFNGDLFPVSKEEYNLIKNGHLELLKSYLTGKEDIISGQLNLWKFFSFDVIPIEFISKIYEEFFHIHEKEKKKIKESENIDESIETGTHYTRHFLVEFLV
ncbi:MAG: hypothetical protein JSW07_06140, partial [bacterium]